MTGIIDPTVTVGKNVTVEPFAVVKGNSVLHDGCTVGSFSYIHNSTVGSGTVIVSSRIVDSVIGANCTVGPNANLHSGTRVGNGCRIGNFVEVKHSTLHNGVKAAHLTYIGDATVGANTNIGCGTIFVNYDGHTKHPTTVGQNCFIGCNCNLVAPLTIGDSCFVACGTTVTQSLPPNAFAIGRSRLTVKENTAAKYLFPKQ